MRQGVGAPGWMRRRPRSVTIIDSGQRRDELIKRQSDLTNNAYGSSVHDVRRCWLHSGKENPDAQVEGRRGQYRLLGVVLSAAW
jgi:hypothetical protein